MSHYNLIYQANPETISEEHQKRIAKHRLLLNNKRKCEFDSADSAMEMHMAKLEQDRENLETRVLNPPLIKKKAPLIKTSSSGKRVVFDSADYFLGKYEGQNLQEFLYTIAE